MCTHNIIAGVVMTRAEMLRHAEAAEAEAARWASEGVFLLPEIRLRDAAALRRLLKATEPAWCAVEGVSLVRLVAEVA